MRRDRLLKAFDVLAWSIVGLSVWNLVCLYSHHSQPGKWYVSVEGSNFWGTGSRQRPWKTIQFACDRAIPGDVVRILPGTYCERVHVRRGGTQSARLIIEAEEPGSVTITGSCPSHQLRSVVWHDEGSGIFSTDIGWRVHVVTTSGQQLFRVPWGGLDRLREIAHRPHACGAFFSSGRILYVALAEGKHPTESNLAWHQEVPPPREWGEFKTANMWMESDHVVIRGLRFEFGIGSAIRVWNASHLVIQDCEFTGCNAGVLASGGAKHPTHLRIERSWYHNTPQGDWGRDWLKWDEIYGSYSTSTFCSAHDRPLELLDNLVTDFADGMQVSPFPDSSVNAAAEIRGNWLAFGTDDAFEFDGPGNLIDVQDNVVIDVHEGISFSPLTEGPVLVSRNVFWNPVGGLNGSQLKFIPSSQAGADARIQRIRVIENIFCGEWLSWRGKVDVKDVQIRENVFEVDQKLDPEWPNGTVDEDNIYIVPRRPSSRTIREFVESVTTNDSAAVSELGAHAMTRLARRPGPVWLNWADEPALSRLLEVTGKK